MNEQQQQQWQRPQQAAKNIQWILINQRLKRDRNTFTTIRMSARRCSIHTFNMVDELEERTRKAAHSTHSGVRQEEGSELTAILAYTYIQTHYMFLRLVFYLQCATFMASENVHWLFCICAGLMNSIDATPHTNTFIVTLLTYL